MYISVSRYLICVVLVLYNCIYVYYLVLEQKLNKNMTLLFFILSPTPDMGRRGLVIDFNFIVYKKKWHVPSHLSYLFHAWINANGLRYMYLYIWRSIYDTLYMYHPSYKMEHNMLCLFSIPYVFWIRQQNNNKGESWKIQQHRIRKGPTVYTDKIDICFR